MAKGTGRHRIVRRHAYALMLALAATVAHAAERDADIAQDPLAALQHGLRPNVLPVDAPLPRWSLDARMRHHLVPGVAIAIVRDGRVVAARGYGVRSAEASAPVDADTVFSVGSISKVVAAAATLRLVDAGEPGRHAALMTDVLRRDLAARVADASLALTSGELLAAVRGAPGVSYDRLQRLLAAIDPIKFAAAPVSPSEARALGNEAREIVRAEHQHALAVQAASEAAARQGRAA